MKLTRYLSPKSPLSERGLAIAALKFRTFYLYSTLGDSLLFSAQERNMNLG